MDIGTSMAQLFSMPASVGAIYGIVFASACPPSLDEVAERLGIGIGTAGTGLKFLQRINAVKPVYRADSRKTRFAPEESIRHLLLGILQENLIPHLQISADPVASLRDHINAMPESAGQKVLAQRVQQLESWSAKSNTLFPWIISVLAHSDQQDAG